MIQRLHRYTELPYLLQMLSEKSLVLLPYRSWEDQNDVQFLDEYCKRRNVSLYSLCFTQADETFHHWKIYAPGTAGVRISFDRAALADMVATRQDLQLRDVRYLTLRQVRARRPVVASWPFVKRYPFRDEREVRLICECPPDVIEPPRLRLRLPLIRRITLGPEIHRSAHDAVRRAIRSAAPSARFEITATTLIANDEWKRIATGPA